MARVRIDNYAYPDAPRLGVKGWLRWMWRQVTSMRVALVLLLVLAIAAIPGSVLPQDPQDPAAVRAFISENPFWGPFLDALGMFDVYGSAWFTAIYVLLFLSLIGCIVPRIGVYWRRLREPVPPMPRLLTRFSPAVAEVQSDVADASPRAVIESAGASLGSWRGYRTRVESEEGRASLVAEHEHVREAGNLLFHVALIWILVAVGASTLLTFRGQAIIVVGDSFANAVVSYDSFESGAWFDEGSLEPFTLTLDEFSADFSLAGLAEDFAATVTVTEPGQEPVAQVARVNEPIIVNGAKVYLQGNGYAPVLTVRDAAGAVVFSGAVPFLPQDSAYTSTGVVKVPDVTVGEQLGLEAVLYPSAVTDGETVLSIHPDDSNPLIVFTAYQGDLGLDEGIPQNVYVLDQTLLSPLRGDDGQQAVMSVAIGETVDLPEGAGSVTFEGLSRFAAFDLRKDPSLPYVLVGAVLALLGLSASLFAPRRRLYLLAENSGAPGAATVVTAGVSAPEHDADATEARDRLLAAATTPED